MKKLFRMFETAFVTGLFILIPVFLAAGVIVFLVNHIDGLLIPQRIDHWIGFHIPGLGLVLAVMLSVTTGVVARNYFGRRFIAWNELWISKIPVGGAVYHGTKKLLSAVRMKDKGAFQKVVLVEFPRPGVWSIGFVTGNTNPKMTQVLGRPMVHVFVPTTPNPTSGFFLILPEDQLRDSGMSVPEGFALLISAGVVGAEEGQEDLSAA